ncbi:AAA family ATPase [Pseudoxanthomonas indica]|uniref:AAA domain-containing protein n=1 Tax=Pseudoxanthomonas indica TaxID=428993 RepID=A0A1T5KCN3_9GAMM|nr:AAA family ATPase [Pseudoxanthomonas indica]GGD48470.1 hypothetical protein GCM10007235_20510 [Pseudoxanthomonas indica]SKC61437.1 AAA domain-containing protein [Pseudoxanthomonas indica]
MNYLDYANRLSRIRIPHRECKNVGRKLYAHLSLATEGDVIFLIGPSRVGKSTILKECLEQMFKGHRDPRFIPYAKVDASQTNQGHFTLKQLWADLLVEVKHPSFCDSDYSLRRSHTEASLLSTLIRTMIARNTILIAVDEGMPMLLLRGPAGPIPALDTLKCLGNKTGAAVVVCGDYTLLDRCFLSAHLNGRMVVIEFPGYSESKDDVIEFSRILASIDTQLPWRSGQSLVKHMDFIYAGTAGCCGSAIKWSRLALAEMGADDRSYLRIRDFERSRLVEQAESFHALNERRRLLEEMNAGVYATPETVSRQALGKPKRQYRPGLRNPVRDPVGGEVA